jgi:hypothetical protein
MAGANSLIAEAAADKICRPARDRTIKVKGAWNGECNEGKSVDSSPSLMVVSLGRTTRWCSKPGSFLLRGMAGVMLATM